MGARWLSLLLPCWPIQRLRLAARRRREPWPEGRPLALVAAGQGGQRLLAVSAAAAALGLTPGLLLTDARAACPALLVRPADPAADRAGLAAVALWCTRWSPRVAVEGSDGVLLDITGCAHLWGGESGLLAAVGAAFARAGLELRAGLAGRRLAARAWARFGAGGILPEGSALDLLPIAALDLPAGLEAALARLGLRRLGDLRPLPRAGLARRFGLDLVTRLAALEDDAAAPPFVPLAEPARFCVRLAWPEPVASREGILAACRRLLADLARALERAGQGARRVRLGLHRVDGAVARLEARAARPTRDPAHLFRLLGERLDGLELGFGVELAILEAAETAPLAAEQPGLGEPSDAAAAAALVDRLAARLGADRVLRPEPVASHVPERQVRWCPAGVEPGPGDWPTGRPRPLRLLPEPLPIEAVAIVPDGPPVRLVGPGPAGRVTLARGPERILPEWWRPEAAGRPPRDLWRARLADGSDLWLARAGAWGGPAAPNWSVLGSFL
jgi:protein ImuB